MINKYTGSCTYNSIKFKLSQCLACLSMIGGVDKRLRLGGLVQHEELNICTVSHISTNGKINVHSHQHMAQRSCRLNDLKPVSTRYVILLLLLLLNRIGIVDEA